MKNGKTWLIAAAIVIAGLTLVTCAVIFLILTGIIAEPETVLTNIVRMIFGN